MTTISKCNNCPLYENGALGEYTQYCKLGYLTFYYYAIGGTVSASCEVKEIVTGTSRIAPLRDDTEKTEEELILEAARDYETKKIPGNDFGLTIENMQNDGLEKLKEKYAQMVKEDARLEYQELD